MLGLLRGMAQRKEITVIMITHKFREVTSFCDSVTVLRRGRKVGGGKVKDLTTEAMARMMIGDTQIRERAVRSPKPPGDTVLELAALCANDDEGLPALDRVNLKVHAGEIVGIAGVSGNGQSRAGRGAVGPAAAHRWPHHDQAASVRARPRLAFIA